MANQPTYWFDGSDPEMGKAYERARSSFRHLWRELSWERRRIVPGLDLACVKTVFSDIPIDECGPDDSVEHMWVTDISFDGENLTGTLINSPKALSSVNEGDAVEFPFEQLTDWMYAISDIVYGGYTVNLMRSRMSNRERKSHDAAWGLNFGDPANVRVRPEPTNRAAKPGVLQRIFGGQPKQNATAPDASFEEEDHPMSLNTAASFEEHLDGNPELIHQKDNYGWTLLHRESLAGNTPQVRVLLNRGADRSLKTNRGMTPADLARRLGWSKVVDLLER